MKVFIVWYEYELLDSVWSTRELALQRYNYFKILDPDGVFIKEMEVDPKAV